MGQKRREKRIIQSQRTSHNRSRSSLMKCIVPRLALLALINKIQNITAPKPAIPILANVLLEAVDDELVLSATDLTVSMRAFVEAKVLEEGAITLPARRFFQ